MHRHTGRGELPEVSRLSDHGSVGVRRDLIEFVGLSRAVMVCDDEVDLGDLEAGHGEVELWRQVEQGFELDRQNLSVPAGVLGEPIVGHHVGALLFLAHVREAYRRHLGQAEQLRCFDAAVAGDDETILVNEDGIVEAECGDTVGDLTDLPVRVGPRIARVGPQLGQRTDDNLEVIKRPLAALEIYQWDNSLERAATYTRSGLRDGRTEITASGVGLRWIRHKNRSLARAWCREHACIYNP